MELAVYRASTNGKDGDQEGEMQFDEEIGLVYVSFPLRPVFLSHLSIVGIQGIPEDQGEELTIWDSKESEFASGLEYRGVFSDTITDLDWTCTPDMQSILAVGFHHHVELLCQQRMTYFDEGPGWAICWKIDISRYVSLTNRALGTHATACYSSASYLTR